MVRRKQSPHVFRVAISAVPRWKIVAVRRYRVNEISSSIESARQRDSIREISLEIFEEISEQQKMLMEEVITVIKAKNSLKWLLKKAVQFETNRNHNVSDELIAVSKQITTE